jgi:predicted RNase H-like nuclease (RuvC/YqgF family)
MSVEALTQEISELKHIINELVATHHAQMASLHKQLSEISNDIQNEAVIRQKVEDKRFLDKINNLGRHFQPQGFTKAEELIS